MRITSMCHANQIMHQIEHIDISLIKTMKTSHVHNRVASLDVYHFKFMLCFQVYCVYVGVNNGNRVFLLREITITMNHRDVRR
jgi:hypothetical protein